jgi:tetratricopeptide (TPR) repeat protein
MIRPLIICVTAFAVTLSVLELSGTEGVPARPLRPAAAPLVMQAAQAQQRARETGDPLFLERAERAVTRALRIAPRDPAALTEAASLALVRHDFRRALRLARRARAVAPQVLRSYPALIDALVETGRLGEAERALQDFLDRKPGAAAYARASYLFELRGRLGAAVRAMRMAVSAGGEQPEPAATLRALLGDLERLRGRRAVARRLYGEALARFPGHPGATLGLAKLSRLPERLRLLGELVEARPLPGHLIALGEAQLAAGRRRAARESFALVRAESRLATDVELSVFEADHGSPRRALRLARRAIPNARALDARGWALTRLGRPRAGLRWARRAVALAKAEPSYRRHLRIAARAAR